MEANEDKFIEELNLTENALRRENGLDLREAYSSYVREKDGSFRRLREGESQVFIDPS